MGITVSPLTGFIGADIAGIDVLRQLEPTDVAAIEQAFRDHRVLRFREQPMEPLQLAAFARHFGELQPHVQRRFRHADEPNIVEMRNYDEAGNFDLAAASRGATENLRDGWHSDLSYDEVPAKATLLHARELPDAGGNTCFSDATRAYEALPEATKRRVAGLKAEFSYGYNTRNAGTNLAASTLDQQARDTTTMVHPVICAHPVTRRPSIFVNPLITLRILDVSEAESDELLDELFDMIDRPELRWEQQWRLGDTMMWDNRGGVMHCGRLDYPRDQRRRFFRATVRGQRIEAFEVA